LSFPTKTSSQSTTLEPRAKTDFDKLEETIPTRIDEQTAALEQQLQHQIDARREERFFWIFALILVSNVIFFKFLDSWLPTLAIVLLELPLLIGLARWLGVDWVVVWLEGIFQKYIKHPSSGE
jgi:hypothetical protein